MLYDAFNAIISTLFDIQNVKKKGGLFSLTCAYWCFYILITTHPLTILRT